jgi:hypothetical protein
VTTPSPLPSPADLAIPPDIDACRPRCRCGAIPVFPLVGMHGDGLTRRVVPWPVVDDRGVLTVAWVVAVGRRFWCPICGTNARVAHAGLRRGAQYGAAIIAALLHVVAAAPLGQGRDEAHAHQLVHGLLLPPSERARSGRPRWSSLRRWCRDLARIWPSLVLPAVDTRTQLRALLAAFGLGAPLHEVLDTAVRAHARGGLAM